jgi:hypothetical protein
VLQCVVLLRSKPNAWADLTLARGQVVLVQWLLGVLGGVPHGFLAWWC